MDEHFSHTEELEWQNEALMSLTDGSSPQKATRVARLKPDVNSKKPSQSPYDSYHYLTHESSITVSGKSSSHGLGRDAPPPKKPISVCAWLSVFFAVVACATCRISFINNIAFFFGLLGAFFALIGLITTLPRGKVIGRLACLVAVILAVGAMYFSLTEKNYVAGLIDEYTGSALNLSSLYKADTASTQVQQASTFAITIDSHRVEETDDGLAHLIVDMTFTNNSATSLSFIETCSIGATQSGVELESAYVSGLDTNQLTQILPGASIDVHQAYTLIDTSEVSVDVVSTDSDETVLASEILTLEESTMQTS